jgi:sulfur-oxidizing protein SoxZ
MDSSVKVRAKQKKNVITVKALITHKMETGARKNSATGKLIPAHFIQEATLSFAKLKAEVITPDDPEKSDTIKYTLIGEPEGVVATAQLSGGVSKNPYVSLNLAGKSIDDLIHNKKKNITVNGKSVTKITLTKDEGYGVVLNWVDNKGESGSGFGAIKDNRVNS